MQCNCRCLGAEHVVLTKAAAVGCDEADVFQLCDGIEHCSGCDEEERDHALCLLYILPFKSTMQNLTLSDCRIQCKGSEWKQEDIGMVEM